jgi:hypothetical protein
MCPLRWNNRVRVGADLGKRLFGQVSKLCEDRRVGQYAKQIVEEGIRMSHATVHRITAASGHGIEKAARKIRVRTPLRAKHREAIIADFAAARGWNLSADDRVARFRAAGSERS